MRGHFQFFLLPSADPQRSYSRFFFSVHLCSVYVYWVSEFNHFLFLSTWSVLEKEECPGKGQY